MRRRVALLFLAAFASVPSAPPARAKVFTRITGEGGALVYDLKADQGNGWYTEEGTDYQFKVGFKQGERDSKDPVRVATLTPTDAEHFRGTHSLRLQIDARSEARSKGAAYKVAVASFKPKDAFRPPVLEARDWYHGFAMKIDAGYYKLPEGAGQEVIFEQFHQGSPFHPPLSLVIVNERDARERGWKDAGNDGHFALMLIDDDHGPLNTLPGKPLYYDLGPVTTGKWIEWVVRVRPSPAKPEGAVTVYMDGAVKLDLDKVKVGYDPANPQYAGHKPPPYFDYADVLLYRTNGDNFQRVFFDEVRFADTLADASPEPERAEGSAK